MHNMDGQLIKSFITYQYYYMSQNNDPNDGSKLVNNNKQLEKKSMKEFIQQRKKQMKIQKDSHQDMETLTNYLLQANLAQFSNLLQTKNNQFILSFLTKQDSMRRSNLTNILLLPNADDFLNVVSQWSKQNYSFAQESLSGKHSSNQFTIIDWRTKFLNFNRQLFKKVLHNIQQKQVITPKPQSLSTPNTIFSLLYNEFFSIQFVKLIIPPHQELLLLDSYLIKLVRCLESQSHFQGGNLFQEYYTQLQRQKAWNTLQFIGCLKSPQLFNLDELNYNFMHELMLKHQVDQVIKIYEYIVVNSLRNKNVMSKLQQQYLNKFDDSSETPIDICLRRSNYDNIFKLIKFCELNPSIYLTDHSLHKLLSNQNITQQQTQKLIVEVLQGSISKRGYIKRGFVEHQISYKSKTWVSVKSVVKKFTKTFTLFSHNSALLVSQDSSGLYPLVKYLAKYKQSANLPTTKKLLPQFLDSKTIKLKVIGLVNISQGKPTKILNQTQQAIDVDLIVQYHQPLLKSILTVNNQEIMDYLITYSYINTFFVASFEDMWGNFRMVDFLHYHFIFEYIRVSTQLGETDLNNKIFNIIFVESKQMLRMYGKFNMYLEMLKKINHPYWAKVRDSSEWLPVKVRQIIKKQIMKYSPQALYKMKVSNQPINPKSVSPRPIPQKQIHVSQVYIIELMKPLFTDQQICEKFNTINSIQNLSTYASQGILIQYLKLQITGNKEQLEIFQKQRASKQSTNITSIAILNQKYKSNRSFDHLKTLLKQYLKYQQTQQIKKYQYQSLCLLVNQSQLQEKLILAVNDGINVKFLKCNSYYQQVKFNKLPFKKYAECMFQSHLQFIQTLIRYNDQGCEDFIKFIQTLPQSFKYQVKNMLLNAPTKLFTLKYLPLLYRPINFNIFLRFQPYIGLSFSQTFHRAKLIFLKDLNHRLIQFCSMHQAQKSFQKLGKQTLNKIEKQLNQFIINGYKYFKNKFNDIKHISLKTQLNEQEQNVVQFYQQLYNTVQKYKQKFDFKRLFQQITLEQIMLNYRFSIFVVKFEKCMKNRLQLFNRIIDEYSINFLDHKNHTKMNLNQYRNQKHSWILFLKCISEMQINQYQKVIKRFTDVNLNMQLMSYLSDDKKIVNHLCYIFNNNISIIQRAIHIQKSHQSSVYLLSFLVFLDKHLTQFPKSKRQLSWQLIEDKDNISFYLKQQQQKKSIKCSSKTIFYKCSLKNFDQVIKAWKKFNQLNNITQQQKIIKGKKVINSLYQSQSWERLKILVEQNIIQPYMIQQTLQIISQNPLRLQFYKKNSAFINLLNYLFNYLSTNKNPNISKVFTPLYIIDLVKAFQLIHPQTLSAHIVLKCLKANPTGSPLFKKYKVSIFNDSSQEYKNFFPLYPYYSYHLDSWTIDLIILQAQILKLINLEKKILKKRQLSRRSLFTSPLIIPHYNQIYSQQQIKSNAQMIFRNSQIKTLKGIPQQVTNYYFSEYKKVKNLQLLHPNLIQELIKSQLVKEDQFEKVITTCHMNLVNLMVDKYKIKLSSQIAKWQNSNKKSFLKLLLTINNQNFIIEFIKKFQVFQNCGKQLEIYSQILLEQIAGRKRAKVLSYCLDYWRSLVTNNKLMFISGEKGSVSKSGLVTLPTLLAAENNFYQYYFLVKSSGNESFAFTPSYRFLFNRSPKIYEFISEMARRINILNTITASIRNGTHLGLYLYIMQYVFGFQPSIQPDKTLIPKTWIESLPKLITYVSEQKLPISQNPGIFEKLTYLVSNKDVGVPIQTLKAIYPNQMRIIQSVYEQSSKKPIDIPLTVVLKDDQNLKAALLKYSPSKFMQYYEDQLITKSKNRYLYLEGVQYNIDLFEDKYEGTLEKFLKQCLGCFRYEEVRPEEWEGQAEPQPIQVAQHENSLYVYRHALTICIISLSKSQGKSLLMYKTIKEWQSKTNFQMMAIMSSQLNAKYFDISIWIKIYQSIKEIQSKPLKNVVRQCKDICKGLSVEVANELHEMKLLGLQDLVNKVLIRDTKSWKDIAYMYMSGLMSVENMKKSYKDLTQQIQGIKTPNYESIEIVIIKDSQPVNCTFEGGKMIIKAYCKVLKCHQIDYLSLQFDKLGQIMKHQYYLEQIPKQINILNQYCADNSRQPLLKNLLFEFDINSFRMVKDFDTLNKLMNKLASQMILRQLQKLEEDTSPLKSQKLYSLSDVYGPVNFNEEKNMGILMESISFYQILDLPNRTTPIKVKCTNEIPKYSDQNQLLKQDFKTYLQFFKGEALAEHQKNYQFHNQIYISYSNQDDKLTVKVLLHQWSLYNIAKVISSVNRYSNLLNGKYDNAIDIRLSIKSVVQIIDAVRAHSGQWKLINEIGEFLNGKRHQELIESLLFMIIEDTISIMKIVRGLIIKYKLEDAKNQKQSYLLSEKYSASSFIYQINEELLVITMGIIKHPPRDHYANISQCPQLISRKNFLDSIFSSVQFLTDYFLKKQQLLQECVRLSTKLSNKFRTHINISIDSKSLYQFISKFKYQVNIKEIDGYLNILRNYILMSLEASIDSYMVSNDVSMRHQIKLFNRFQSMIKNIPIDKIYQASQIIYETQKAYNTGLKRVNGLQALDKRDEMKNMFLVQIYKSYFSSMVTQGMTFILGHKFKDPTLKKLENRNDINHIDIVELSYLLWVTPRLPADDELKVSKIIRLFVSDLGGNIYLIDDVVSKSLLKQTNEDRNIADLAPIVAPNMMLYFPNPHLKPQQKQQDSNLTKIFEIQLNKQPKFKILPQIHQVISLNNQIKTDQHSQKAIQKMIDFFQQKIQDNITIEIVTPPEATITTSLSQIISLVTYQIQYAYQSLTSLPMYSNSLQKKLSFEKDFNALTNFFSKRRNQLLSKHSKTISVQLGAKQSQVTIQDGTVFIKTQLDKAHKLVNGEQIATVILSYLIHFSMQTLPKNVKVGAYEGMTKQTLIKVLDSILQVQYQIQQVQLAFKLYQQLHPQMAMNYLLQISLDARQQFRIKDNVIELGFRIDRQQRQFYHSSEILSFLLTKTISQPQLESTFYNPLTQVIEVKNSKQQMVTVLFVTKNSQISCQKVKLELKNGKSVIDCKQASIKYYFVIDNDNVYWNTVYQFPKRNKLSTSKTTTLNINNAIYFQLLSNKKIDLNTLPINVLVKKLNNSQKDLTFNIIEQHKFKNIKLFFLSQQAIEIQFLMTYSSNCTLNYPGFMNSNYESQSSHINFVSTNEVAMENTKFIQLYFRNRLIPAKKDNKKYQHNDDEVFKEPLEKKNMNMDMNVSNNKQAQLMVYVVNQQSRKYLTRAGQQRIDYVQFCDADSNPVQPPKIQVFFQHTNRLAIIQPEIKIQNGIVELRWTPTVRGHYLVYINNICVNPQYQIGVCASYASPNQSKSFKPKVTSLCFAQQTECSFNLIDSFGNIYTQLQQAVIGDSLMFQVISSIPQQTVKLKTNAIDKYGNKKLRFSIQSTKVDAKQITQISVLMNRQKMLCFELQIKGQALKQRRKNLQKQIQANKKNYYKQIKMSRSKFLEQLFVIAEKSLHVIFSVTFQNQQGIDAGGLKRQFYDMIGKQFKNQRNSFFKPIDQRKIQYFIDPEILKNKKKKQYMQLLGKYLANSILNSYLIGVSFSPVFVKLFYEDPVTFDDLLTIIPQEQAKRYTYLLQASQQQLEDLQLYFTIVIDKKKGKQIELKQGGKQIKVNKQNVKEYTQLLSQALISDRFKDIMQSFRGGFNSVLNMQIIRRWIRPDQFWALTIGTKQITPQVVLSYITFGSSDIHSGWFQRYITEASQQILVGFLKFSSGSSSIDFDRNSKITVTFERSGQNPKKLPISHTCWKQIIVPRYKSYEIMSKLLNAAFLFCSEGFGFG